MGQTGTKTFLVNQDGVISQKDQDGRGWRQVTRFDLDPSRAEGQAN